ncbi:MAG TPA: hypothetical protein VHL08_07515 [Dongiaceae bacterium]|jgi:hypothetical protein|nr:hypothetical protein [Dongiaceae bacterium]
MRYLLIVILVITALLTLAFLRVRYVISTPITLQTIENLDGLDFEITEGDYEEAVWVWKTSKENWPISKNYRPNKTALISYDPYDNLLPSVSVEKKAIIIYVSRTHRIYEQLYRWNGYLVEYPPVGF